MIGGPRAGLDRDYIVRGPAPALLSAHGPNFFAISDPPALRHPRPRRCPHPRGPRLWRWWRRHDRDVRRRPVLPDGADLRPAGDGDLRPPLFRPLPRRREHASDAV